MYQKRIRRNQLDISRVLREKYKCRADILAGRDASENPQTKIGNGAGLQRGRAAVLSFFEAASELIEFNYLKYM